jgi:chromosome segregation ATPase
MSELVDNLKKIVTTFKADSELIQKAADRLAALETNPGCSFELQSENDDLRSEISKLRQAESQLRLVIQLNQDRVRALETEVTHRTEVINEIAKAAECEPDFSDILIARVAAQNQQSNAMTRICEGHIATARKAENTVARLNQNLSQVQNERDDLRGQITHRCALLHDIADALGAGSRNAVPAKDWYMEKIEERIASRSYRSYLEIIGAAVDKKGLSYKDLAEYFRGLDIEGLKKLPGKLADAERAAEARQITLHQLANALGINPMDDGWCTKMIDKAGNLVSQVYSKQYAWDKQKTEALKALLQSMSLWPTYNNVDGMKQMKLQYQAMEAEVKDLKERIVIKNNYISKLEHAEQAGFTDAETKEQLKLAHESIKRLELHIREANTNLEDARKGATTARYDLALAEAPIKRMWNKLVDYKQKTSIWPPDDRMRAKLDDVEWCLNVYIGRAVAADQQHEADTMFIAKVRDSLSHEILRRNDQ